MNTGRREIVQRPGQGSKDLNSGAGLDALSSRQGIISFCPKGNLAVSIPFSHITVPFLLDFLNFFFFVDHPIPTPHQCTGFNRFALLLSREYSLAWFMDYYFPPRSMNQRRVPPTPHLPLTCCKLGNQEAVGDYGE